MAACLLAVLLIAAAYCFHGGGVGLSQAAAAEKKSSDDDDKEGFSFGLMNPNLACYVCHMTFIHEEISKVHLDALTQPRKRPDAPKLVLVSATTPTAAGEGKTTTSIGLAQGLRHIGESVACALRDPSGQPYDLSAFIDDSTWMLTRKTHNGVPLLGLERPGLWNGSMAGWNTVFVEIPRDTFHPVKTLADLLRSGHMV